MLFVVEVTIAVAVDDDLIRPYVGDVLVVMLIHAALATVAELPVAPTAGGIYLFACAVEVAQWAGVGELAAGHPVLQVVIGSTFQWGDLVAYGLGCALVVLLAISHRAGLPGLRRPSSLDPTHPR